MYKIGLSSYLYSETGSMMLMPQDMPKMREGSRRVSRSKTLDGGVVITDSGYCDGDRTFSINTESTEAKWGVLWTLMKDHSLIVVCTDEGAFSGVLESVRDYGDKISINILIKAKLSA